MPELKDLMKIVALIENTTRTCRPVEHGLSLYIETDRHCLLFDTGQSPLLAENAAFFGVDLKKVDLCFLSHGHYDHGGGLAAFAAINDTAPIYMSRHAFEPHYHGPERYIGLNRDLLLDSALRDRFRYTCGTEKLDDQLTLLSPGRDKTLDMGSAGLLTEDNGRLVPEDFRHEQYLMIEENGKRVLFSGCSHQGILNIMNWFRPDVLVGGFHFMTHPLDDELLRYGKMLSAFDTTYYTSHCTGVEQFAFLQPLIPRMHYLSEGEEIRI